MIHLVEKSGQSISESIKQAAKLSDYAVEARYPGLAEPVTRDEYDEAIKIAEQVVNWAENVLLLTQL